ncbi:MAG TPA: ABC transporter ATP-binding protein [Verrucomicrobiae bacterium]|nr:ABC transporter ATP-binding protein [Verrucomicrobiae bacterium]
MHFSGAYEEEITGKAYDRRLMRRFVRYLRPYRGQALLVLLILPFAAVTKLLQPYVVKIAIDDHITRGDMQGLPGLAALFLLLVAADSLLTYLEIYLLQNIGQRIMADLRQELFAHVQRLSASFFDRTRTGALITRLTSDVEVIGEMFAAGIVTVVGDLLVLAGIMGIMLWLNVRLSLVVFSVLPPLLFVVFRFRTRMRNAFREVRARLSGLNSFLAESLSGMTVIQLFARERSEREAFSSLNRAYRDSNFPVITWDAALFAMVEMLASVAGGLIIWYGGGEVVRSALTFGALVAFLQYSERFFGPIRDLSGKYSVMQGAMAALERIFALLDTREFIPEPENPSDPFPVETIEFRDVWFAYREGEYILKGLNLTIRRGETVALVGETGGGKTTVTRLLSRQYEVTRGSITINGVDIREIPLCRLRRAIVVVLQEPTLFSGTLRSNISLGDPQAGHRVEASAAAVGADRFIGRLEKGLGEEVRERGSNFSAGERQLVSFARALAFDPEVLVLDEATASIDSTSEQLIRQGLRGLLTGRTSLVVAHRLSTVRDAHRIVVIHKGEKREEGTHRELLAAEGIYYRLHQLQFREESAA